MNELRDLLGPVGLTALLVALGGLAGITASRLLRWPMGGPITLFIAAPLVPTVDLIGPLTADDVLPLVGLGLVALDIPRVRLTDNRLLQIALGAVAVATAARVLSTIVNAAALDSFIGTMGVAVLRPLFLVAVAVAVAASLPADRRQRYVATGLGLLGTFEAVFSLAMFLIPIHGVANRPLRLFETLAGCDARITGTLGLSPNHVGAVFVVTMPFTVGLAIQSRGVRRWMWAAAGVIQAVALTFTFTRASIALAVVGVVFLLLYHRQWLLAAAGAVATVALITVVSAVACAAEPAAVPEPTAGATATSGPGESATPQPSATPAADGPSIVDRFADPSDRLALWYTAALMTLDYPVAGVGIHRMSEMLDTDPARYIDTPFGKTTASAHNTILLAGAETGIVGALSMAVLNVALGLIGLLLVIRGWRRPAIYSAAGVAIIGFLAQGMLNNLLTVPATATLLAVVVGAFGTARVPESSGDEERSIA